MGARPPAHAAAARRRSARVATARRLTESTLTRSSNQTGWAPSTSKPMAWRRRRTRRRRRRSASASREQRRAGERSSPIEAQGGPDGSRLRATAPRSEDVVEAGSRIGKRDAEASRRQAFAAVTTPTRSPVQRRRMACAAPGSMSRRLRCTPSRSRRTGLRDKRHYPGCTRHQASARRTHRARGLRRTTSSCCN